MAIPRAERSLRVFALRQLLLELLQRADVPMTIAAIWDRVRENGGEAKSADQLGEIDAMLNALRNNAYPA